MLRMLYWVVILCGFCGESVVCAAEYHLSPSGDDTTDGSELSPWKTLEHATSVVTAGDTVWLHTGVWNELHDLTLGSSEAPVIHGNVDGLLVWENHVHHCDIGVEIASEHKNTFYNNKTDTDSNGDEYGQISLQYRVRNCMFANNA